MEFVRFIPHFGEVAIALALGTAVFSIITAVVGNHRDDQRLIQISRRSLYSTTFLLSLAAFTLIVCLTGNNFLVRYVYSYSNRAMPLVYKFTAFWGGQEGSLLFWVWITSIYGSLSIFLHRKTDRILTPHATAIFAVIIAFFSCLLVYAENPFVLFPEPALDGRGLNPLLQNPSMAIHPPSLYLGFTGMSVPFAFALSALINNQLDTRWITATRTWTLIAWFFLSVGNLLGAQWAYVELGWGGFWGWDPVENAAILPWFTASAFLHSVMIQEKRGMLKFWNMNLIAISFCLTILGTYLTRSGVVQSVHSFARSNIGYYFLGFLIGVVVFSGFWIYKRRKELRSTTIFESFLSKESAFVVNNIVLVGCAFIILWCTLFPTISELLVGSRVVVGPPFFNKMLAPLAIILLILTGIGPIIAWRKSSPRNFRRNFLWPIIVGLVAMGAVLLLKIHEWYAVLTAFGAAFVITTIVEEFQRGTVLRMNQFQEKWCQALLRSSLKNNRKYGGYIVHLGMVMIFIGIAGTVYKEVFEFDLKPGQSVEFKDYSMAFQKFEDKENENQFERFALVDVYRGENYLASVRPARFYYKNPEQPTTEVDIISRLKEDIYFTLGNYDEETGTAKFQVTINPLISFLWLGGLILVMGGLITMLPTLELKGKSS